MHISKLVAAAALLFTSVTAVPSSLALEEVESQERGWRRPIVKCLNQASADKIAGVFQALIQNYTTQLALETLTEDFVDYSSAVNIIMNRGAQLPKNITGPTFANRTAFMSGQGSQPKIPFQQLNSFFGCRHVVVRWQTTRSANGQAREVASIPVVGNAIISVVLAEPGNPYQFRIKDLYSEFNAAAWLVNLGVFKPNGTLLPVDTSQTAKRDAEPELLSWDEDSLRGGMI